MSTLLSDIRNAAANYKAHVLEKNRALREAETFSNLKLAEIRQRIQKSPPPAHTHVLATAGSLARLEASGRSDLDLIITTSIKIKKKSPELAELNSWRNDLCMSMQVEKPNPNGVFIAPIHFEQLVSSAGRSDEAYADIAKRILILLESTWLDNPESYNALLDKIILKYADDVRKDTRKNFVFLLNDIVRFFRAICVNYQYTKSDTESGKWPLRNIKLRHSRVVMYFSLVAVIGLLSRVHTDDKVSALTEFVKMTPLRRLAIAYELSEDGAFYKVAQFYNQFLALLSTQKTRDELNNLEYSDRYASIAFAQLKANSDGLSSELLRFFEAADTNGTIDFLSI